MKCIDSEGNRVGLGHTPGPWEYQSEAATVGTETENVCLLTKTLYGEIYHADGDLIAAAPWHALLLKAVLKGWTIYEWEGGVGHEKGDFLLQLHRPIIQYWLRPDNSGLPACPDAETYERIRKAVEGD